MLMWQGTLLGFSSVSLMDDCKWPGHHVGLSLEECTVFPLVIRHTARTLLRVSQNGTKKGLTRGRRCECGFEVISCCASSLTIMP